LELSACVPTTTIGQPGVYTINQKRNLFKGKGEKTKKRKKENKSLVSRSDRHAGAAHPSKQNLVAMARANQKREKPC
jgi:hypothetical protein